MVVERGEYVYQFRGMLFGPGDPFTHITISDERLRIHDDVCARARNMAQTEAGPNRARAAQRSNRSSDSVSWARNPRNIFTASSFWSNCDNQANWHQLGTGGRSPMRVCFGKR